MSVHLSLDADDDSSFDLDAVGVVDVVVGDIVDDKIAIVFIVVVVVCLDVHVLDICWMNYRYTG